MKPAVLLLLLLLGHLAAAKPITYLDLTAATARQDVTVSARADHLGPENLRCTLTNRTRKELPIRVPPGLHFAAGDEGAQDLFTFQEKLLVLAPGASVTVRLWGFCMEQRDHAPGVNAIYGFRGLAGRGLQPLGDSLQKYPRLAEGYGQLFVWVLTDHEPLRDLDVAPALRRGATNVLRYLSAVTGQPATHVRTSPNNRPSVRTFSRRAYLNYHSPTAQVTSVRVYGPDGHERYVVTRHWALTPGVMRYSLGINAIIGADENAAFTVRLLGAAGQVLQEMRVTDTTPEVETAPARLQFGFLFSLDKAVKNVYLRMRLPDGTLVEEFKQLPYLPAGNHQYNWTFYHLRPAGTPFVARLETADGRLLREQPLVAAAP